MVFLVHVATLWTSSEEATLVGVLVLESTDTPGALG